MVWKGLLNGTWDAEGEDGACKSVSDQIVALRQMVEFAIHQVVAKGVHAVVAKRAWGTGVPRDQGETKPPFEEAPVFWSGKIDGDSETCSA